MQVASTAAAVSTLPPELMGAVLQQVSPGDVDSFGRTCRANFAFVNDTHFIDGYVRHHANDILQPPTASFALNSLRQKPVSTLAQMRALTARLHSDQVRRSGLLALRASGLLGPAPCRLTPVASGEVFLSGITFGFNREPGRTFGAAPLRRADDVPTGILFVVLPEQDHPARVTATLRFPTEGIDREARRTFTLYSIQGHIVALCSAGSETWVHLVRSNASGATSPPDNTSAREPLMRVPLTIYGMAPIAWDGAPRAVLTWADGRPELLASSRRA